MKYLILIAALALPLSASAQKRVHADDLQGSEWKVKIHMEDKADEADSVFERMVLSAVSGLVEDIDIRFHFLSDGLVHMDVTVFGEENEDDEDLSWEINRHGGLILGDSDHFETDGDTVFYFVDGDLVGFERNDDGKPMERNDISLIRIRR